MQSAALLSLCLPQTERGHSPNEDTLVREDPLSLSYMSAATVASGRRSVVIFLGVPVPAR